jgi:ArsR family transcriptional regulator, arsenate/arsenite/antimonite-responsive transcriptional repressor
MDETYLAERLSALGHVTRLRIARYLIATPGGMAAGKIAASLGIRQNSLSPHLGTLVRNGLIIGSREGREVIYSAQPVNLQRLVQDLMESVSAP